ncbi:UbiA family prenyltransferase [Candidatus Venteria ishoeyi]|nr:UbiA family prenyltransferase [Candidatus Venteria ishoeyi]
MNTSSQPSTPLCVDLDGTLLNTDLLFESLVQLLKKNIFYIFMLPVWLSRGRATLKHEIALRVEIEVRTLPYHEPFLNFLKQAHAQQRPLYLVTASNILIARKIAEHLNLFSDVIASDKHTNLKGKSKGLALKQRFGEKQFAYAGNDTSDLAVWQYACTAIVVNAGKKLQAKVQRMIKLEQVYPSNIHLIKILPKVLRIHQWVKNFLIFIPLLAAHRLTDIELLTSICLAFLAFCLVASAGYVINDIVDLEVDRQHHTKNQRPFASGEVPILYGFLLIPILLGLSAILVSFLPLMFGVILILYFSLTLSYSLWLKCIVLVDVFCLALLYTLRVIAGVVALQGFNLSYWLLAFSMFLFLCLAFVKRYSELLHAHKLNKKQAEGRGYITDDLSILANIGISGGYISVLVLALYINSQEVRLLYQTPDLLWLVCLLLLYWISYIWVITHRGLMHDDPVVFALRDRNSYLVVLLMGVVVVIASLWGF